MCLFRSTYVRRRQSASGRLTSPAGGGRGPNHWHLWHRAGFAGLREVHAAEEGVEAGGGAERIARQKRNRRVTFTMKARFSMNGVPRSDVSRVSL